MAVRFFNESNQDSVKNKNSIRAWIIKSSSTFGKRVENINFIFVSNEEIKTLNSKYLNHDYFTDIITFDYTKGDILSGDIYIAPGIVKENADSYDCNYNDELKRVIIHGILHLVGFKDTSEEEKIEMRLKEDFCLSDVKDLIII